MKEDRSRFKTILLWAILFIGFIVVFQYVKQSGDGDEIPFSEFVQDARQFENLEGKPLSGVQSFEVRGSQITGLLTDGTPFRTEGDVEVLGDYRVLLLRKGVQVSYAGGDNRKPAQAVGSAKTKTISFSEFLRAALEVPSDWDTAERIHSKVKEIEVRGNSIKVDYYSEKPKKTSGDIKEMESELLFYGIALKNEAEEGDSFWARFLISWIPMILLLLIFFLFIRQLQSGGGKAMSFGKSRHRLLHESSKKVTFDDIAGIEEAKDELKEIVDFLKDPKKYTRLGGKIPKGVLLLGPPGTGKTLLARGVAGEAGVPFLSISGSDFVEMFVGVGASRVRDLFEQGKKSAPCIIFIDEIDAVGRHRGAGLGGGHDEREQTLNQLLVEMDGFESNEGVILVAATNRADVLDPALLRPGRFDRRVMVPLPDMNGRLGILTVHCVNKPLGSDVSLENVARGTPGFSGADLANLVNEAALLAARREHDQITGADMDEAKDKVLMGSERRSTVLTDEEKRTTAYHESGHALVARFLTHTDPVYKVTIIPRGGALGLTQVMPERDRHNYTRNWLEEMMSMLMGGRVAEELVFGVQTTGAGNDIMRATQWARRMVTEWGMSNLGPVAFEAKDDEVFLGRDFAKQRSHSEAVAQRVDREIKRLVHEAYDRAWNILAEHRVILDDLAETLIAKESLNRSEIEVVLERHGVAPREDAIIRSNNRQAALVAEEEAKVVEGDDAPEGTEVPEDAPAVPEGEEEPQATEPKATLSTEQDKPDA